MWREVASGLGDFDGSETEFTAWVFALGRRLLNTRALATDPFARDDEALAPFDARTQEALARVAGLPDDEQDVLLLRALAGLPLDEVAWIVGKPHAVVRTLEQRALERLMRSHSRAEELVA